MRVALFCTMLVVSVPVAWADTMRCGDRLVADGDPAGEVLAACGEPDYSTRGWWRDAEPEETWTYNFGPDRLLQVLQFRRGELVSIRPQGYGFDTSPGADPR